MSENVQLRHVDLFSYYQVNNGDGYRISWKGPDDVLRTEMWFEDNVVPEEHDITVHQDSVGTNYTSPDNSASEKPAESGGEKPGR